MAALEAFRTTIAAIDARIAAVEVLKTQTVDAALENVAHELVSARFGEDIGRVFDSEINWLRFKRDQESIAYARSVL